jgi:lipoprotein-anchoring transpeptidase ErfK/SrfK
MIYAGQWLKVINGPFDVRTYKSRFEMQVWLRGRFIKAYSVALGRGNLTPVGNYVVKLKVPNPPYQPRHKPRSAWRRPEDPDNPLGERWIAFETNRGLGIHGTIEPASIGKSVSDGCVRMLAKDVVELYDFVVPGVSKVSIKP